MRFSGRLHDWNDARGFGFVTPNGGGERAFVHIRAFARTHRRPVDGDLLNYAVEVDGRGRRNAVAVRFADAPAREAHAPRRARPFRATGVAAIFAIAVSVACFAGLLPWTVVGVYAAASALLYFVYLADKAAAQRGRRRTPESTLHLLALVGGWPGAAFAQQHFEHKRSKRDFVGTYVATIVLNVGGLVAFAAHHNGAWLG
ncbi:MAG TPA: cold shock and DUF1294 domain-containing protein [Lysobacter sp.]|nr:cold shock and DUF1294 domain-containing protein [Lysobacter sp.]